MYGFKFPITTEVLDVLNSISVDDTFTIYVIIPLGSVGCQVTFIADELIGTAVKTPTADGARANIEQTTNHFYIMYTEQLAFYNFH